MPNTARKAKKYPSRAARTAGKSSVKGVCDEKFSNTIATEKSRAAYPAASTASDAVSKHTPNTSPRNPSLMATAAPFDHSVGIKSAVCSPKTAVAKSKV